MEIGIIRMIEIFLEKEKGVKGVIKMITPAGRG
jgi:hypothetical protein